MSSPTLDGAAVFGTAVKVQQTPRGSAQQINAFFGINGTQVLYGGTRGRTFFISGLIIGSDIATLTANEAVLLSYDDGIARVLVDTLGRSWPYVVFRGEYQADPMGPRPLAGSVGYGWGLPYRAVFYGLV